MSGYWSISNEVSFLHINDQEIPKEYQIISKKKLTNKYKKMRIKKMKTKEPILFILTILRNAREC